MGYYANTMLIRWISGMLEKRREKRRETELSRQSGAERDGCLRQEPSEERERQE